MPAPLLDFATARASAAQDAAQAAQQRLVDAQRALAGDPNVDGSGLRNGARAAEREVARLNAEIGKARRALAGDGLSPAELAARIEALHLLLLELRAAREDALAADAALKLGEREAERARAAAADARRAAADATAFFKQETARAARRADHEARLGEEPLVDLPARAGAAQDPADPLFAGARGRLEGAGADLPAALRTRAVERYGAELDRLAAARQAVRDSGALLAAALAPSGGAAPAAWAALAAAEETLASWVNGAPARLAEAVGLLAQVRDSPEPTAAEAAALADPERVAAGEEAVDLEKTRDDARAAFAAKQAELDKKRLEVQAADVEADPDDDLAVQALLLEVGTLADQLQDAEDALEPARAALDDWEATVPETVWASVQAFERARRLLAELAATDPADLLTALDAAETALADALAADAKARRTLETLTAAAAERQDRADVAAALRDRRLAGAVRGDQ